MGTPLIATGNSNLNGSAVRVIRRGGVQRGGGRQPPEQRAVQVAAAAAGAACSTSGGSSRRNSVQPANAATAISQYFSILPNTSQ